MDNQQPRSYDKGIRRLCLNARFGDGYFWKHPECVNYKLVYTSTTPELLQLKSEMAPNLFTSGVRPIRLDNAKGRFPNAKPMFRLASVVHKDITEFKLMSTIEALNMLTIEDLALWYLDDGCTILRKDGSSRMGTRTYLCVGNLFVADAHLAAFNDRISALFGTDRTGAIRPNNSRATSANKTWCIPTAIAKAILEESSKYGIMRHKFPHWIRFRDHSHGEVGLKGIMQLEAPEALNTTS